MYLFFSTVLVSFFLNIPINSLKRILWMINHPKKLQNYFNFLIKKIRFLLTLD